MQSDRTRCIDHAILQLQDMTDVIREALLLLNQFHADKKRVTTSQLSPLAIYVLKKQHALAVMADDVRDDPLNATTDNHYQAHLLAMYELYLEGIRLYARQEANTGGVDSIENSLHELLLDELKEQLNTLQTELLVCRHHKAGIQQSSTSRQRFFQYQPPPQQAGIDEVEFTILNVLKSRLLVISEVYDDVLLLKNQISTWVTDIDHFAANVNFTTKGRTTTNVDKLIQLIAEQLGKPGFDMSSSICANILSIRQEVTATQQLTNDDSRDAPHFS